MKKSLLNMLGVAAFAWSTQVFAAGIGGINVTSALGQPLNADVDLVSVSSSEKSSLVARLASQESYKAAGLSYPFGNKFKFDIQARADGEYFVHVTSSQPINDPFVSLLLELSWASGKLMREFTFLLDPVGYQAEQPVAAPVQAVAPVVAPAVEAAPVVPVPPANAQVPPVAEPAAVPPAAAKEELVAVPIEQEAKPLKQTTEAKHDVVAKAGEAGEIKVRRGDTLNKIAAANKLDGVSLERMLVAMYRANADQFDGKNMNRIRTGKILRLPDTKDVEALTQAEARKEIHAQVSDWNAYRQKLASAAPVSAQQLAPQQASSGKVSSVVADKTPVAKESAKEVLKLSKGDAVNDKVAAGKTTGLDKKNAEQEEAIAKAKAAEEERKRVAMLEKKIQDQKRLAELKTQAAALVQTPATAASAVVVAASPVVANSAVASSVVAATSAVAASGVTPVAKPVAQPAAKPVAVEPSLVDEILDDPVYLGGGAAAILGLGGLAYAVMRRKNSGGTGKKKAAEDIGSITGHIATPVIPSPDTGDFTMQAGSGAQAGASAAPADDPISEADLFLSFGRDAQAEDILKEALQSASDKTPIKLKLMEIYASRNDTKSFEGLANQVKSSGDDRAWQQVVAMGSKLDPKNALYGEGHVEDSDSATMQTVALAASELAPRTLTRNTDFDVTGSDMEKTAVRNADESAGLQSAAMDFDVTATNPKTPVATDMVFDVTGTNPKLQAVVGKPEVLPNLEDLVFDVTSTNPALPAAKQESAPDGSAGDMPFVLDFPTESAKSKPAAPVKPAEFDLSDIDLNLGGEKAAEKSEAETAQWHEVATKLDLAKAYQEMGDAGGAKEILEEVMKEGDAEQRAAAQDILKQLG